MIRLAEAHPEWVLGYVDEVWWSRLAQPRLHTWNADEPLRLVELVPDKSDPDPKALACYGLLRTDLNQVWLRFVEARPVSAITTEFLAWVSERLQAEGKKAWLLVWDNASWHISREVRRWIREHNRQAKQTGGARLIVCQLPTKSPWLNPIEPRWMHGKRAVVEPDRKLTAQELKQRIWDYYGFELLPHLSKKVA
ncbi:MAG TPA: transposase [Gammaproteobacteria bacterium]|nr:transposase [Gammaproteobacteria bacterium]